MGSLAFGDVVAALLCGDTEWVARRKETVVLLDDRTVRRRISIDCSLPEVVAGVPVPSGFPAPVALLRKAPAEFTNFDFTDEGGRSVPLPTRRENARYSAAALIAVARQAASRAQRDPDEMEAAVAEDLRFIATADTLDAERRKERLFDPTRRQHHTLRNILRSDDTFPWLCNLLAANSIVARPLTRGRAILKLSYDEHHLDTSTDTRPGLRNIRRKFGWEGYTLWIDLPYVGSSSFHFEAQSPRGIEISDSGVAVETSSGVHRKRGLGLHERVHVYFEEASTYRNGLGWVVYRVYRGGFITWATLATTIMLAAFVAAAVWAPRIADRPTGVPALLLLFPGLIAAAVARPGRHALALRLLSLARWLTLGVAGLAYVAAARTAVLHPGQASDGALRWFFVALAGLTLIALAVLTGTRLLPRPYKSTAAPGRYRPPEPS